jgi:glycine/D-amino acid oxidase-like deaminating enzyme
LLGQDPSDALRRQTALASEAIGAAVVHPLVAHLDDDTLRTELLQAARRLLDVPTPDTPS